MSRPEPSTANGYLVEHINLLCHSFQKLTNRDLIDPNLTGIDRAQAIFYAPFVVVSHDHAPEPIFNYGNQIALDLFAMTWPEFTTLPSRRSAEPQNQAERSQFLATVEAQGFADHYAGVRISKTGRRFMIENVTVWNLHSSNHMHLGQAASYRSWRYLD